MSKKQLFLLHFNPIEVYPPVLNALRFLERELPTHSIRVLTTRQSFRLKAYHPTGQWVKIHRCNGVSREEAVGVRFWKYVVFYGSCLWRLVARRPDTVLYYDTLSSFPALLYKCLVNRQARILVHYHEYTSPDEYQNGMRLVRFFHWIEKRVYPGFAWISHTNRVRLHKFVSDHASVSFGTVAVLPNFPPRSWRLGEPRSWDQVAALRIVYVGSLSSETMFFREFCGWVRRQAGSVTFDVYAYNLTEEAKEYLNGLQSGFVRLHPGIDYEELPAVLSRYHVGVVLYKGLTENHIHSAPNKVFEYLACGLDVWFSKQLLGTHAYLTAGTYPKVMTIDFEQLGEFSWPDAVNREGLTAAPSEYYCEKVLDGLLAFLKK